MEENEAPEIQVNAANFFLLFFFFVLFLHKLKHSLVVHNYTLLSKRRLAGNRLTVF